jgi:hypothetical protein
MVADWIIHAMSMILCFVYLVLFYKPFQTFMIYFTCIVSLFRSDPTPLKIDRRLVFQTLYTCIYIISKLGTFFNYLKWEIIFDTLRNERY